MCGVQGRVHRQIYGECNKTKFSVANLRLNQCRVVVDLVDAVHQRVVAWNPEDRGYDGVQEGLCEIFNGGWNCAGRRTGS